MHSILIVDDEPGIRDTLRGVMEDEGFAVEAVASGEECQRSRKASLQFACCLTFGCLASMASSAQTVARRRLRCRCRNHFRHGNVETAV